MDDEFPFPYLAFVSSVGRLDGWIEGQPEYIVVNSALSFVRLDELTE